MSVIAEYNSIEPIIVFNKCDMGDFSEFRAIYENAGFKTFVVSAEDGFGIAELEKENRRKFKSLQIQALHAMTKLMQEGSFQATKYILDGNYYAPTEKHEVDMTANITVDYGDDDEGSAK